MQRCEHRLLLVAIRSGTNPSNHQAGAAASHPNLERRDPAPAAIPRRRHSQRTRQPRDRLGHHEALRVLDAVAVRATNGQEYPQHLSPDEVGELRAEVGLPQTHLNQILSRLHQEHLVEYDEWSQPFGHCRLAPRGILLTEWLKDRQGVGKAYQALAASVSCRSTAGEFSRIATLAADTGAGSLLVYAILKAWEERDLLHVVEVVGPPSSCLVEGVRPLVGEEARRLPLEVFDTPPPPRPRPSELPDTSRGSRLSTEDFVAIEDAVRTGMIDLGTAGRW